MLIPKRHFYAQTTGVIAGGGAVFTAEVIGQLLDVQVGVCNNRRPQAAIDIDNQGTSELSAPNNSMVARCPAAAASRAPQVINGAGRLSARAKYTAS